MRLISLLLILLTSLPSISQQVRVGGQGELYFPVPLQNSLPDGDRLRIRSVEVTGQSDFGETTLPLYAKVTVGGDDTSGDLTLNLREGYLSAQTGPLALRAGKFYLPIGLLNQTRRSAWPMISAPRAISLFFTETGVVDTGGDLTFSNGGLQIRAGATNGYRFDSAVSNTGLKPLTPTHFARPSYTFSTASSRISVAGDYLARVADDGTAMRLAGLDAQFFSRERDPWAWEGQMEIYHRYLKPAQLAITEEFGGYLFMEKGLGDSSLAGLRADAYKNSSLRFANGDVRKNLTLALSPTYTYRAYEYFRAQVAYTVLSEARDGDATRTEQSLEFRIVSEFGDIPKFRTPSLRPDRSSL